MNIRNVNGTDLNQLADIVVICIKCLLTLIIQQLFETLVETFLATYF